jgi:hypothetical protein
MPTLIGHSKSEQDHPVEPSLRMAGLSFRPNRMNLLDEARRQTVAG